MSVNTSDFFMGFFWWLFHNEDFSSHDPTLQVIKHVLFSLLFLFIERPLKSRRKGFYNMETSFDSLNYKQKVMHFSEVQISLELFHIVSQPLSLTNCSIGSAAICSYSHTPQSHNSVNSEHADMIEREIYFCSQPTVWHGLGFSLLFLVFPSHFPSLFLSRQCDRLPRPD